jgi:hypothetical protein
MTKLSLFSTISLSDLEGVTGGDNTCIGWCPAAKQEDNSTTTTNAPNYGNQINPQTDISVLPKGEKT